MNRDKLREMLIEEEGLRLKPYRDTVGKLTIGVGRNLDDRGISRGEAMHLLDNDIDIAHREVSQHPVFNALDSVRQLVLVNMAFNMGYPTLLKFRRMWAALERRDYEEAADEMLDSRWAGQVGMRAERLARIMADGKLEI